MRINVSFERKAADGPERVVITDDRGHLMPSVRGVDVKCRYGEASEVVITLVVDRTNVTLGPLLEDEA